MRNHLSEEPQKLDSRSGDRPPRQVLRSLGAGIWALGFGSLLMDASSELVHSLLPMFMARVLGASMTSIGLLEGVAEGTAAVTKVFSGSLSDRLRKRKPLVVLGYGLAALSKPMFPLATSLGWVFAARFIDRIGKGIREAPRDALIADITPEHLRGAAYGLRQSLDSVGAFVGPALALGFMVWFGNDLKAVLWVAVFPALMSVALLTFAIREPDKSHSESGATARLTIAGARRLGLRYWTILFLGAAFTLARFSEAFLVLRAQNIGFAIGSVPIVMIAMNIVYAAAAYPAGAAADWVSRQMLLLSGLGTLIAADIVLAVATTAWHVLAGAMLWGLQMALTQGLMAKLVAESAPEKFRGTAFGLFNLASGAALIVGSTIAGLLWDRLGPAATFIGGAGFAAVSAAGLLLLPRFNLRGG